MLRKTSRPKCQKHNDTVSTHAHLLTSLQLRTRSRRPMWK